MPLPSRPGKAILAALLALLCSLTLAAAAQAEPGWQLPSTQLAPTLSEPESYGSPVAATGTGGEATVATVRRDPAGSSVLTVHRTAGEAWQAPLQISGGAEAYGPAIAMSPGGAQTVAWLDGVNAEDPRTVWVAERDGGEAWRGVHRLPRYDPEGQVYQPPEVAEDPSGDAVVVWEESNSAYTSGWLVASERHGGTWTAPHRISVPAEYVRLNDHAVEPAGTGRFLLAWADGSAGLESVEVQTLVGGSWTGEQTIQTEPGAPYVVSLAANGSGQAAMIWSDASDEAVHAASLQNGSWTLTQPAATHVVTVCSEHAPVVAIDAAGDSQALWLEADGRLRSETMVAGGAWRGNRSTLATIPETGFASGMEIGVDPAGDALAAWASLDQFSPPLSEVEGAAKPAGGSWQPSVTLDSGGATYRGMVSLADGADGSAVASWLDETQTSGSWEEAEFAPRAVGFGAPAGPAQATAPTSAPPSAWSSRPRLGSVYLLARASHLWVSHASHELTVPIRNTNPFPVSGTVRLFEYLLPLPGHAHVAALAVSRIVHYRLAAHQTSRLHARLSSRVLRRLRSYVPDRGHILVNARLAIRGEGQSASSSVVLALDQRMRRHPRHKPHVPAGYPAPVNPWAQKSC